jgi:hypothetical protein
MVYDPFVRGMWPVGVRSAQLIDRVRTDRLLPLEAWGPVDSRSAGQDLDRATQDTFTVLADAGANCGDRGSDAIQYEPGVVQV